VGEPARGVRELGRGLRLVQDGEDGADGFGEHAVDAKGENCELSRMSWQIAGRKRVAAGLQEGGGYL
jgi:hypothetical protein